MPGKWRGSHPETEIQLKMREIRENALRVFRIYRMRFTEKILLKVMEENADVEENIVVRTSWTRKCSNPACGKCFTTLKRKCDLCFSKVLTSEKEIVRLSSNKQVTCREYTFDSDVIPNQVSLKMGEPSMVNAYDYFINAKYTHKSHQTLLILLEGTASEMCLLYLKDRERKLPINAAGFMEWCSNNSNETFSLVYQIIFNFAFAIYLQKVGVRMNNWEMIDGGRMKFLPFFYSFNHPIYQEVEYRDLANRAKYPSCVTDLMSGASCYNNYQVGDFCLENKIQKHKQISPKGRITYSNIYIMSVLKHIFLV